MPLSADAGAQSLGALSVMLVVFGRLLHSTGIAAKSLRLRKLGMR